MTTSIIGRGVTLTVPEKRSVDDLLKSKYKRTRKELSPRLLMLLERIEDYVGITAMGRPATPKDIADAHQQFTYTMLGIIDGVEQDDPSDAMIGWDLLLFIALQNKTTHFNPRMACRHFDLLATDQQQTFLKLMNLVMQTMDIRDRADALRRFPLDTIYPLLNEIQRKRLTAYYAANT